MSKKTPKRNPRSTMYRKYKEKIFIWISKEVN